MNHNLVLTFLQTVVMFCCNMEFLVQSCAQFDPLFFASLSMNDTDIRHIPIFIYYSVTIQLLVFVFILVLTIEQ